MVFLRRLRKDPKFAEGTAAALARPVHASPAEIRARETAVPSPVSSTRSSRTAPINEIPPGMPLMPDSPPSYARLGERRVSSIDEPRRSASQERSRRRLRVFGRGRGANRRPASSASSSRTRRRARRDDSSAHDESSDDAQAREMFVCSPAALAAVHASAAYDAVEWTLGDPAARTYLRDLSTKGRYVGAAEEVADPVRVHDNFVSFVVPHGWIATRTEWGFYLSSKNSLGFVLASSARDATKALVDTRRLSVFSEVRVMSSPVFESRHSAVVRYAAHDMCGRG